MDERKESTGEGTHDLVVLSDMHLGEGKIADVPRYSPTEDFFHDQTFARFLGYLHHRYRDDPSRLLLVLNGDTFDFLTITRVPDEAEAHQRGFKLHSAERKFGLNPSEAKSLYKLDLIVSGHQGYFAALAQFVGSGFRVEILRGNHDLELYYDAVRERLLEHLVRLDDRLEMETARERVTFHQWFYLEPGRLYIEHGNQYDESNSIRYPLRPVLSAQKRWRKEEGKLLDYPLGSIFVRFFYNRVRWIDPYTPRLLSFEQYLDFVRRYNFFDLWRVFRDHYPHFVAALGPMTTTGSSRSSAQDDARQEEAFDKLADESIHGDLYRKLNDEKIYPAAATKPALFKEMVAPLVRRVMWLGVFAFAALFIWLLILQAIDKIPWITANAFLMSLFAVLTLGGAIWIWIHFQRKLRRRKDVHREVMAERASEIARIVDVPLVLMGHTHLVDYRQVNNGHTIYANSGTWTSVNNPWNRIMRDARRLTFLYVQGDAVELCRWNDDASRIDDVPLFHLEDERFSDNLRAEPIHLERAEGEHSWLPSTEFPEINESESTFNGPEPPN